MKLEGRSRTAMYLSTLVLLLVAFGALQYVYTRRVDGVSMLPTLEGGDMVVLQFVGINDMKPGDIIVFNDPTFGGCIDFTIIHRVVGIATDGGLITQGDDRATNPIPDEPTGGPYVHQQCLVGKVVFVIPYIERLADLLPYPTNYVLAALIIVFVIISEIRGGGGREEEPKTAEAASA